MSDQLPPNPYRCVNCLKLCEKPHPTCPECGQAGSVLVRDNLDETEEHRQPQGALLNETYRCIDCGNLVNGNYKECPVCRGRALAPTGRRAPMSSQFLNMIQRW